MGLSNKVKCLSEKDVTDNEPDEFWRAGEGGYWGVDVDADGVAYTFYTNKVGLVHPDDEEVQHVQDFFAGKYCKLRGHVSNDCLAGPEQFGNWSK